MNEREQQGVIAICILSAFADGQQSEAERAQVQRVADGFQQNPALATVYQEVLGQRLTLAQAAERLESQESRALAYEMAVCVCDADSPFSDEEKRFLADLRRQLRLDDGVCERVNAQAEQLAQLPPVIASSGATEPADPDTDRLILNSAILTGALELLPNSLATMAIIPIQIRMVYRIGKRHGFELSRGHIKEFLATVGVGMTSQVVEGYVRKIARGLARNFAGKLLGGVADAATGSALSFGTTYALGQVAKRYYSQGRNIDVAQLRDIFSRMLSEGNILQPSYTSQIMGKARTLNPADLLRVVREA